MKSSIRRTLFTALSTTLLMSGQAFAVGPDLLGWKLDMSPSQIKENLVRVNPRVEWMAPAPQVLGRFQGGGLIGHSHFTTMPLGSGQSFSFATDLANRVFDISITQTLRSDLPLAEVLESALIKYGKPFKYEPRNFDFAEQLVVAWGGDPAGKPIIDIKVGNEECHGGDEKSGAGCSWVVTVFAQRKTNTGIVEIRSTLGSPALRQAAYKRAIQGKAQF